MKKIIIVLIFTVSFGFFGNSTKFIVFAQDYTDEYLYRSAVSIELYQKVYNYFDFGSLGEDGYPEGYAGSYINDDGDFVLCYTHEYILEDYRKALSKYDFSDLEYIPNIIYEKKRYDYNTLITTKEELQKNLNISYHSIGIKNKDNKINIYIEEQKNSKVLKSSIQSNFETDVNEELYAFVKEAKTETQSTYTAYAGTYTYFKCGLFNLSKCGGTVGFNAKDLETGEFGIVTNAHVAESGKTMLNANGNVIGIATKRFFGGFIDAAFVPFTNTSSITWQSGYETHYSTSNGSNFTGYLSSLGDESIIVEGAPTYKIGISSKYTTGKILLTNMDVTINGTNFTGIIKYSNASKLGDSGGPVWIQFGIRGPSTKLIALNFAGPRDGSYGLGVRAYKVTEALNVVPVFTSNYGTL